MSITRTKCPSCGRFAAKAHDAPHYACQCGRAWDQERRAARAMIGTMPTLAALVAAGLGEARVVELMVGEGRAS